jgi:peptidoglycan/xylan/chitin deacetylase (PgdA/CDA1 family)
VAEPRWHSPLLIRASLALHTLALVALIADPASWPWLLAAVALNHLLIAATGLWPRSHWLGPNWTRLPAAATARHEIALTIDDGPDPEVTPQVLDLLDRYAARATFFCIGERAARYPELCREIVRRGHAVENHSQHHRHHFSLMGPAGQAQEIQPATAFLPRTGRFAQSLSGTRAGAFRPDAGQLVATRLRHPRR